MTTLLSVVTALCLGYFLVVPVKLKRIPESLSATYYDLGSKGWLFQAFMFIAAVLMFSVWLPFSSGGYECLVFLSCASLLFVAAAPSFRLELEGKVHYSNAILCGICVVLWQVLEGFWDVTLWFGMLALMLSLQWRKQYMWWVELALIGSLLANLWRVV